MKQSKVFFFLLTTALLIPRAYSSETENLLEKFQTAARDNRFAEISLKWGQERLEKAQKEYNEAQIKFAEQQIEFFKSKQDLEIAQQKLKEDENWLDTPRFRVLKTIDINSADLSSEEKDFCGFIYKLQEIKLSFFFLLTDESEFIKQIHDFFGDKFPEDEKEQQLFFQHFAETGAALVERYESKEKEKEKEKTNDVYVDQDFNILHTEVKKDSKKHKKYQMKHKKSSRNKK